MSVPIEVLRGMGLTPEQIAKLEAQYSPESGASSLASPLHPDRRDNYSHSQHDALSSHLDRILNAPTGLNKWSTDPINRVGFLLPTMKPTLRRQSNSYLSKSMENMIERTASGSAKEDKCVTPGGKENTKRSSEEQSSTIPRSGSGLKKARSNDELSMKGIKSPLSRSHLTEEPADLDEPVYAWGQPAPKKDNARNAISSEKGERKILTVEQVVKSAGPKEAVPKLVPGVQKPTVGRMSFSLFPPSSPFHADKAEPEMKAAEPVVQEEKPISTMSSSPAVPKTYSMNDLLQEFGSLPSATSSMNVEVSPACCPDDDKYGSFYNLRSARQTEATELELDRFEAVSQISAIQTEPIMRDHPAPLSAVTDLSHTLDQHIEDEQLVGLGRPDFSGVLQSRFASKYEQSNTFGESQMTMVGSTSSVRASCLLDEFECDGELADVSRQGYQQAGQAFYQQPAVLAQYPLLSPAYSSILRNAGSNADLSPTHKSKGVDRPEFTGTADPACSALLNGIREEITQHDQTIYLNYRNCMRHGHTALPLSFQEVKQRIEEYGMDIRFKEERRTTDLKQLFLLPLNLMTVPRWVPPGTSFRIGRSSNWFLSQSRVVSRNHCELFHDIHSYYVKDIGSRSGTYLNGSRIGEAESISLPRELKHGDILQVGIDYASEKDQYGAVPERFRSAQVMVLYGYKAKESASLRTEVEGFKPTERVLKESSSKKSAAQKPNESVFAIAAPMSPAVSVSESKFERLARKALAMKSRLASANSRLFVEFGDYISETSAGTAILHRPNGEPSYSFLFNNYRFSWDIGMTCRRSGKHYGLALSKDLPTQPTDCQVYQIFEGQEMERLVGLVKVQGDHKVLLEPVYERNILDEEEAAAERDQMNRALLEQQPGLQLALNISSPSAYLLASPTSRLQQQQPISHHPAFLQVPSISSSIQQQPANPTAASSSPSTAVTVTPRNPFYTLTGDLQNSALAFYVQRYQNCRKQVFLGEGQVTARKSAWGKKTIFYEARLPPAEMHDELLALVTLFNVLNQLEKI